MAEFRLTPLLNAATLQFESAEQRLSVLRRRLEEARAKLGQLEQFKLEYAQRLRNDQMAGLPGYRQQDYLAFLAKLDAARQQQGDEVARCKLAWDDGFNQWRALKTRVDALLALQERHRLDEQLRERRQDQKQQDEFAARRGRNLPDLP